MFNELPFETELRDFLVQKNARFIDQTRGFFDADFALMLSDGARFALEVKEKRQPYTVSSRGRPARRSHTCSSSMI
jgi:hypothetical protein